MPVLRLDIHQRTSYAGNEAFGDTGAYERIDGRMIFAVDPTNAANATIVDLDRAARDAAGRVHFAADFCVLQPADPLRGNGRLLLEAPNRGRKLGPAMFNLAASEDPPTVAIDPGDGFLFRRGWTLAWCGWQWDVIGSDALMGFDAPAALEDRPGHAGIMREIEGQVSMWWQPNVPSQSLLLADRVHVPYPVSALDDPEAILLMRDWPEGLTTVVPRSQWQFARDEGGVPVPDDTHLWLDSGFVPGKVYEAIYRTRRCPVVGTGLLAMRDGASFLRFGDAPDNPCAGRITQVYGYGMSQSGRFLREYLAAGLNRDEKGRQVFDGLLIHVAGARGGEFNHRYAQPSQQHTPGFGHLPPFTDDDQTDPLTGETDGLLRCQRAIGGVPKIFSTNTSAEYWRGDCSLVHTDLAGHDLTPPQEVRVYHFAGTQHGRGKLPLTDTESNDGARGAHAHGIVDYAPLMRAALVNLDRWVSEGTEPPANRVPLVADGTAVPMPAVLDTYRAIPGATVPNPAQLPNIRRLDLGSDVARGVGTYPAIRGERYPIFVAAVDADGNERAGIRLPDLTVPVATGMGWNPRHPETGGAGQIIPMQGSTLPFAATAHERERTGDPRPAIAERYASRDAYLARVRVAAGELIAQEYVLADDLPLLLDHAAARYDALAEGKHTE